MPHACPSSKTHQGHFLDRLIEITERRNLFAHTDGVVSEQYRNVCEQHGHQLGNLPSLGSQLDVSKSYLERAFDCLASIAVLLAHSVWRKHWTSTADKESSNRSLTDLTFGMICEGRFNLASRLLELAIATIGKTADEPYRLRWIVNRAQALKWLGKAKDCQRILASVNWSTKHDNFRLCNEVLCENWSEAAKIMARIGATDEESGLTKDAYAEWPIFREWRQRSEFLETYRRLFGEDFSVGHAKISAIGFIEIDTKPNEEQRSIP